MGLHLVQENFDRDCVPSLHSGDVAALSSPSFVNTRLHPTKNHATGEVYTITRHINITPLYINHYSLQKITTTSIFPELNTVWD